MKTLFFFAFLMLLTFTGDAFGQKMTTPKAGSTDHKAILNAIKEYDTEQRDEFSEATYTATAMRVQGTWAFASVEPKLQGDGESLNYGVGHVFLQKTAGVWKVVFSTHNDRDEVGVDGLDKLKKKHKAFPKALADFAMNQLAG